MHLNILNNSSIYMNQIEYIVYLEKKKSIYSIYMKYVKMYTFAPPTFG